MAEREIKYAFWISINPHFLAVAWQKTWLKEKGVYIRHATYASERNRDVAKQNREVLPGMENSTIDLLCSRSAPLKCESLISQNTMPMLPSFCLPCRKVFLFGSILKLKLSDLGRFINLRYSRFYTLKNDFMFWI